MEKSKEKSSVDQKTTKPPIGLVPRFIRRRERLQEIREAIARYTYANREIPSEWVKEYNEKIKVDGSRDSEDLITVSRKDWEITRRTIRDTRVAVVAKTRQEFLQYVSYRLNENNHGIYLISPDMVESFRSSDIGIYHHVKDKQSAEGYRFTDVIILSRPEVSSNIDYWEYLKDRVVHYRKLKGLI